MNQMWTPFASSAWSRNKQNVVRVSEILSSISTIRRISVALHRRTSSEVVAAKSATHSLWGCKKQSQHVRETCREAIWTPDVTKLGLIRARVQIISAPNGRWLVNRVLVSCTPNVYLSSQKWLQGNPKAPTGKQLQ